MSKFAIIVRETGSDRETELCRVGTEQSASALVKQLVQKKAPTYDQKGRRSKLLQYDNVRYTAISIAIAIIGMPALGSTLSASPRTASVMQCRTFAQARAAFPNSYLAYRRTGTQKCWFVSPGHAARKVPKGKVSASAPTRPADPAIGVTAGKTAPRPLTFQDRWILR